VKCTESGCSGCLQYQGYKKADAEAIESLRKEYLENGGDPSVAECAIRGENDILDSDVNDEELDESITDEDFFESGSEEDVEVASENADDAEEGENLSSSSSSDASESHSKSDHHSDSSSDHDEEPKNQSSQEAAGSISPTSGFHTNTSFVESLKILIKDDSNSESDIGHKVTKKSRKN
jgi:cobalamin biosynthesis Mg chelatase CobN